MAPSISRSCAVSRRMRANSLLSMIGNYRPCSGPEKSNGGPGQPRRPLRGASESIGRRCFCDRSVLFRQAGSMKQVAEARVGTHGIVDRLHLYEKEAGPLPLGLFQPGEGAFLITQPRIDYCYGDWSNVALFGALFQQAKL